MKNVRKSSSLDPYVFFATSFLLNASMNACTFTNDLISTPLFIVNKHGMDSSHMRRLILLRNILKESKHNSFSYICCTTRSVISVPFCSSIHKINLSHSFSYASLAFYGINAIMFYLQKLIFHNKLQINFLPFP